MKSRRIKMNFSDVVVTIFVTVVTAVITFVGYEIRKNEQARAIFNVLEPLAKDAVIAAQKLGVTEYLSGVAKKNHAVQAVIQALLDAGFTVKDKQVVINAVEKAYAQQAELLKNYPQAPKPTPTDEELEKAKEVVAQKEAELAEAKAKVANLNA